ncbi:phosphotriesterase [Pediococcus acidilactici]|uniref:phosphotriesterase family protein n=1 Tax=Pediococcus acidilactici TaxID=1254 RepID=UPI001329870F|nr:phosphotriesterase-related protein [Pediococcus acidilactici]KAF0370162.1 phosphotriesterase-related protein [Pediococcus acidilactici]KAF0381935.1 phosphotriesterase-related protein [Pediococcus acidilactici]KAF0455139.1 phosphotriesterase-related protein [Pediococcus acidilactici]KAF0477294.1 phosphotriesterase-related protein [Pediococcus acidilactici]KAF0538116.1 phosphotriesterase-related protein [Pediococcus acidilactici]
MLVPGMVYSHEHVPVDLSEVKHNEDCHLDSQELVIQEFRDLYSKGIRNVISMSNRGMGRNIPYAEKVADESGINIVQSTGFYQDAFLPVEVFRLSVNQLATGMIKDIEVGIKGTNVKAGVIGEIATTKGKWTLGEEKVFEAALIAQKETGCPISTHTSMGTLGHEQVNYFIRNHADLSKIVIGHVDLSGNANYVIDMLKTGINVEFDTIGKNNYLEDSIRAKMLKKIEQAGFTDQIVLSMDITRKSHLKANGGNGYAYLLDKFVPTLLDTGVSEKFIHKMLNENPQRIYGDFNA